MPYVTRIIITNMFALKSINMISLGFSWSYFICQRDRITITLYQSRQIGYNFRMPKIMNRFFGPHSKKVQPLTFPLLGVKPSRMPYCFCGGCAHPAATIHTVNIPGQPLLSTSALTY